VALLYPGGLEGQNFALNFEDLEDLEDLEDPEDPEDPEDLLYS
jgi:hypothetical protein